VFLSVTDHNITEQLRLQWTLEGL